jgi:hypothetical protein
VTARRAAQKRGEGFDGQAGQPARHLGRAEHGDRSPRAPTVSRPGASSAVLSVMRFEEVAMRRRLRRRHHDLDHAQSAVGVALIFGFQNSSGG